MGRLCNSGADIGIGRENPVVLADALSELVNSKSRKDMHFKKSSSSFFLLAFKGMWKMKINCHYSRLTQFKF